MKKIKSKIVKNYSDNRQELIINLKDLQIGKVIDLRISNTEYEYFYAIEYINGMIIQLPIDEQFISLKKSMNKNAYELLKLEWEINYSTKNDFKKINEKF